MDAPTTTSAENGSSDGSSGAWGWFTPSKKPVRPSDERQAPWQPSQQGAPQPSQQSAQRPPQHGQDGRERIPSRPVTPIRPVGSAASREDRADRDHGPERGPDGDSGRAPAHRPEAETESGPGPQSEPAHVPALAASTPAASTPAALDPARSASPDAVLIRRTMAEIEPVADKVTGYFYALLFVRKPELRELFPAAMDAHRGRVFKALLAAAEHVDDTEYLTEYLSQLGRGHRKYGTQPDHYPALGECLLASLARFAPNIWGPEIEAAWVRAYTVISQMMIDGAAENERYAPAWWNGEIVAHELRTPDVAVVTVRTDHPYPFLAGQYTSLETPWWPRVWRNYSFAAAPRDDGLLSFHIKAVPAGWVSNALVHRAGAGDVIRLGPPTGSMTVDHRTDNGLLCLGGGTGIAPIKALIEDIAEQGHRRSVEVFYGARSDHDLYDIDTMLQLERSLPWLSVRPVVSEGPASGPSRNISGKIPDAVRQYGPWREHDAYVSGPPGMIRSGVDALVGVGVPSDRIRHDAMEELVTAGD